MIPQRTSIGGGVYKPVPVDVYDVPFEWRLEDCTHIKRKDYSGRSPLTGLILLIAGVGTLAGVFL